MSGVSDIDREYTCCLCDETGYFCTVCEHATCGVCLSTWEDCPVCPSVCLACTMRALEVGATGGPGEIADLEYSGDGADHGVRCIACGEKTLLEIVRGASGPGGQAVEHQYRCQGCQGVLHARGTPALAAGLEGHWFRYSSATSRRAGDAARGLRVVGREPGPMQPGEAAEGLDGETGREQHGLQGD